MTCSHQWDINEDYCEETGWGEDCMENDQDWFDQEGVAWMQTSRVQEKCFDQTGNDPRCLDQLKTLAHQCENWLEFYGEPYLWDEQCDKLEEMDYTYGGQETWALMLSKRHPHKGGQGAAQQDAGFDFSAGAFGAATGFAAAIAAAVAYQACKSKTVSQIEEPLL